MSGRSDEFARQIFRAAQQPVAWFYSASRLRNGAEAILKHELPAETPYFNAVYAAEEEANAIANSSANDSGAAKIKAVPPNYPPAQLLYAYAIENVLKGLIISKRPRLVDDEALTKQLATHDLTKLAAYADFTVHAQERPVLKSLSQLSRWAGRYPVALTRSEFVSQQNADQLLDYGSHHPYMRSFFDRAYHALETQLPTPPRSGFGSVVVFRQPM